MRTNDNIHLIEEINELTFPIKYKDEVVKVFRLGFERGRKYVPLSDKIKAIAVILAILVLSNIITANLTASANAPTTQKAMTDADINTVYCLIQEYEAETKKTLSDWRKGKIQAECAISEPTLWKGIVKCYGDEVGKSAGGKPH